MMLKKPYTTFIFISAFLLTLASCSSKKQVAFSGPVPDRSKQELIEALESHNYDFNWYAIEAKMKINNPEENVKGKAYIRIKRDSIIWIVAKKMSVEAVRAVITPDSFAAVNRLDAQYQIGKTMDVTNQMGMDFGFTDMQHALFGNIILPDTSSITIYKNDTHYDVKGSDQNLKLEYKINAFDLSLTEAKLQDQQGRVMQVSFDDYKIVNGSKKLAHQRTYQLPFDERGQAFISLEMKKIELDIPKTTKFSIPSHYEQIF